MDNIISRPRRWCLYGVAIAALSAPFIASSSPLVNSCQLSSRSPAGQTAPKTVAPFNLQNLAGGYMTNEDLIGKVAVVDVWATWCGPCVGEVPIFNRLQNEFQGKDVAIVGIAVDSPRREIPLKVRQLGIKYPILIGDNTALSAFGNVQAFPTTVVLNRDGKIYKSYRGSSPGKEQNIKQDVERLLAEDAGKTG